jgi:hypothetical protein
MGLNASVKEKENLAFRYPPAQIDCNSSTCFGLALNWEVPKEATTYNAGGFRRMLR